MVDILLARCGRVRQGSENAVRGRVLPKVSPYKIDIPVDLSILSLSVAFVPLAHDLRSATGIGGRYGEAWWGGVANLHQCIPRTPSAFSSAWHRTRLGALLELRCLG